MNGLRTKWGSDTYTVAADDWSNAACHVMAMDEEGEWFATGKQVADHRHDVYSALRYQLKTAAELDALSEKEAAPLIARAMAQAVAIADGEQPRYRIESAKGTHELTATNRADAIREAREWQREMQAAYADLIGPRGGKLRL